MIPLLSYPRDLALTVRLGSKELTLKPFNESQVEPYVKLLERSTVPDSAFTMHPFYAAYEPLAREEALAALAFHARHLETHWDGATLPFMVWQGSELVGFQHLTNASSHMKTDSFVAEQWRASGLGTLMRAGVLAYGFKHLGQQKAVTSFVEPNCASEKVSVRLGYKHNSITPYPWGHRIWQRIELTLNRSDFTPPQGLQIDWHS